MLPEISTGEEFTMTNYDNLMTSPSEEPICLFSGLGRIPAAAVGASFF